MEAFAVDGGTGLRVWVGLKVIQFEIAWSVMKFRVAQSLAHRAMEHGPGR
jgi:hypothetical protein